MKPADNYLQKLVQSIIGLVLLVFALLAVIIYLSLRPPHSGQRNVAGENKNEQASPAPETIPVPDTALIPHTKEGQMIRYGRELIANTAMYIGRNGSVGHFTNNMNCQNCHLNAGTKPFGNNYLSVHATYPKYRERSGEIETEAKRVTDCMERSLNGKAVAPESKEMLAILAYLKWVGTSVKIGEKVKTSGLKDLPFMSRAADPAKGRIVYTKQCQSCHGAEGEGKLQPDGKSTYPPLWGAESYNDGAGLYRITFFARYVKYNMPFGAAADNVILTDEDAWDVAAFVNTQTRPHFDNSKDWPDVAKKPVDHPFGPYKNGYSEAQHKYGPYKPIEEARKNK